MTAEIDLHNCQEFTLGLAFGRLIHDTVTTLLLSLDVPFEEKRSGSAMPLAWAHAEYIMLLRSARDGRVFEWIPEVAARYLGERKSTRLLEIWKFNRQIRAVKQGYTLRIQALASFRLRWSINDWQRVNDTDSTATAVDIEFVDIPIDSDRQSLIHFTFFWSDSQNWENCNYQVAVVG